MPQTAKWAHLDQASNGKESITLQQNSNVFHVTKLIPYKKKVKASSSSSRSSSGTNHSYFSNNSIKSFSSVSSKTDSELKHVSTPSEKDSASSREDLNQDSDQEIKNQEKMVKKAKFPKVPLYLDDS